MTVGVYASRVAAEEVASAMLADFAGYVLVLQVGDDGRWALVDETPAELFL